MVYNNIIYYTIQPNDTLYNIAQRYQVTIDNIVKANPEVNLNILRIGQVIKIPLQRYISQNALNIINTFRKLWEQHGAWTRMVISSIVFDIVDKDYEVKRLLRNPKDFAEVLKQFYDEQIANQFDKLLTEHLVVAADLVNAAKAGDAEKVSSIEKRWKQNGINIARFLSQINPYFIFDDWQKMMLQHLNFVKTEAVDLINKQYQKSIDTYDAMETHILNMADMMAQGIIKQFNIT